MLTGNALEIKQTSDYSDSLIGIENSQTLATVIVRQDIDLLVLPTDKKIFYIFFLKHKIGKIKTKLFSSANVTDYRKYMLLAYAFSGCDTTSSIRGEDKKICQNFSKVIIFQTM